MNLLILLLFGILSTSHGIYEIPEHDPCVLRVLLCDDFTKPLTPVDNSTLEMFETIGELNAVCEKLSRFRVCLKNAEIFCKEYSGLDIGFQLLNNRRLAFDLCERASSHQHVYMMVEGCVNKYSHAAIEFCTDKAVETVGLEFDLGDYESECRFLGEIQYCHIAVVTNQCGSIAGNLLEKLVIFRGERDFMCSGYEKKRLSNIEAFYNTMDSYIQQYMNIVDRLEKEEKSKRVDTSKKDFKTQEGFGKDQVSRKFQSRISPITGEDGAFGNMYPSDHERPFNSETFHRTEKQPLYSLSEHSTTIPPKTNQCLRHFHEMPADKVLSYENSVCNTKVSFLLTGIRRNGKPYPLGCGEAYVLWATSSPLKDISCAWMVNPAAPHTLARCSILIGHPMLAREFCQRKVEHDLPFKDKIIIYEIINSREAKRVAELRVYSFVKHSSTVERSLKSFKKHAQDIRYWCADQHEANKYKESNWSHSESRIGLMPSDDNKNDIVDAESRVSDQKFNFYASENAKYPKDTEFHLISSADRNLENEFEVEDTYASPNYDENLIPLVSDEIVNGENLEPFTLSPSKPSKSSQHLYWPYELYRPRVGEVLEVEAMSSENLGIANAEKGSPNPKMLSIEDAIEDKSATHLNIQEICPVLPENISKLVNKLVRYSKENYMNMADPLEMDELESYTMFPIYNLAKGFPFISEMWKVEEPENINAGHQQNLFEEIYVVTPSTEIEIHGGPDHTMYGGSEAESVDGGSEAESLDGGSQISNIEGDNEELVKLSQETDATNPRSSKVDFLQFTSNYQTNQHPFSYKFIDASTNLDVTSKEEFSAKSEKMFNRRSDQEYPTDMEEIVFNVFEVLAEIKINVRRMHKILRETRMKENSQIMIKTEL